MDHYDSTTYGDAFADVYDEWYAGISDVDATVGLLTSLLAEVGGGPVLELAVGTGRLAIPLAEAVADVWGVDSSEAMLTRLRSKAGGEAVELRCADMATDLPKGPFALVFVAYNSLFNLSPDDRRRCLRSVADVLLPGGHFVVEAFVPDASRPSGSSVTVRSMSARHVVLSVDVHDAEGQSAEGQFVEITESGGVRLRPWSVHFATPDELDVEASGAGLRLTRRWEDWNGSPFDADSPRHVSVYVTEDHDPRKVRHA